jgi:predicted regulator of Ras-like GTPase activity (Roadblock/LC7/MglB family)
MEEVCRCGRAIIGGDGVVLAYDCPAMVNPVAKLISVHWGTICVLGTVQFAQFGMVKVTVSDIEGEEAVTFMSENPASIFKVLFY